MRDLIGMMICMYKPGLRRIILAFLYTISTSFERSYCSSYASLVRICILYSSNHAILARFYIVHRNLSIPQNSCPSRPVHLVRPYLGIAKVLAAPLAFCLAWPKPRTESARLSLLVPASGIELIFAPGMLVDCSTLAPGCMLSKRVTRSTLLVGP